jgi:tol-pal system protein YbgF
VKLVAVLLVVGGGCIPEAQRADTTLELRRQVDSLRAEAEQNQKTIKELENRVFVLEDKLESAPAQAQPPLPVVHKQAPALPPSPPPAPPSTQAEKPIVVGSNDPPAAYDPMTPRVDPSDNDDADPTPAAGDGAMSTYKDAYAALQRHDHLAAVQGFSDFLAKYPRHDYANNAQYWLGETYYDQADYKAALSEFRKVIKQYPTGIKVPDALLKIGFCYGKLGDPVAAKDVLAQVVQIYGKSDAARLAQKRLEEMHQ